LAKKVVIVEVSERVFRVVEIANQNNGIEMIRYAIRNLPPEGLNSEWLKKIWDQEHFSRNRVAYLLSPNLVNFKTVILPVLPAAQMEAAVSVELNNSSTRGMILSIIGYQLQNEMYHVKVALIKDNLLTEQLRLLEQAGLRVEWSGVRARGIENFINFNQGFFEEPEQDVAYLDLTEDQTEFGIFNRGNILYRRDFVPGGQDLITASADENNLDAVIIADFLEELRLSIASYRVDYTGGIINKLWIFGYTEHLIELLAKLSAEMDLKAFTPNSSRLTGVLTDKNTSQLAPLIGLALEATGYIQRDYGKIYTESQKKALIKQKNLINVGKFVLVGLGIFIGLALWMQASIERKTKVEAWLQEKAPRLVRLQYLERDSKKAALQIKELESWLGERDRELEFLKVLLNNIPAGTKVTDLTIENGIIKDLAGVTPSVSLLLSRIRTVPELSGLKLKGTITTSSNGEIFHLEGKIVTEAVNKESPVMEKQKPVK
jgi:hypothetical protein